jgi:hypothetical protein
VSSVATGALAIGALAIARLSIIRASAEKVHLGTVEIDDLTVRALARDRERAADGKTTETA